jgi:ABC-type multidrug transport system ATPase subunit
MGDIIAENVTKRFGPFVAVDSVSIVADKEIIAIMGPNGSGKTTLLSMLGGALKPSSGKVYVKGIDLWGSEDKMEGARRYIGFSPQATVFERSLTGYENLVWIGMARGLGIWGSRRRAKELVEALGLADHANKPVSRYSGGMLKRLSIASALIHDPEVIVLDEPASGLDPSALQDLWSLLLKMARGRTIIYSTHNPYEAERYSTRVFIMHRGKMVVSGSASELIERYAPKPMIAIYLPEGVGPLDLEGFRGTDRDKRVALYETRDPGRDLGAIVAAYIAKDYTPERVEIRRPGLGEVFLRVTGEAMEV